MRTLTFALVVLGLCGCSTKADLQAATAASDNFHQQMASANFAAIYESTSDKFRTTTNRETLFGFLQRVNRKLGPCDQTSQQGFNVNYITVGKFVSLTYSRKCANAEVGEQFVWKIEGGKALLVRYNADSPVLLTD
jgi:hypothetical protein